jgi:predicted  nucleic acid-binding Zn-ribbon protein
MTKEIIDKLEKLDQEMYGVNRQISWNYIAMKNKPTEQIMNDLNRFIGQWIKQIREIKEEMEEVNNGK